MKVKILKTVAMAYSKDKVIDKVESFARPINEHLLKCYLVDCSGEHYYEHWLGELKGWLNKLYTYKYKSNTKPLPAKDFYNIFMDTDLDSPENLKNIERYTAENENLIQKEESGQKLWERLSNIHKDLSSKLSQSKHFTEQDLDKLCKKYFVL